jgi:thioredoxin reductase (NADPH)
MHRKIVIIGSGPAGHTAAIYAGRALLAPLMLEGDMAGGVAPGGQLTTTTEVENYPGFPDGICGVELMQRFRQQSVNCGVEIVTETVESVDLSSRPFVLQTPNREVKAEAVILATGATAKRLGAPGEEKYWQRGISACAICDGALPIFRDQQLIVVGGGDSACEEALFLTKYAKVVTILVRRDVMRASKVLQKRVADNGKIDIKWKTEIETVHGNGDKVTHVTAVANGNERFDLECGGLFYAIGHTPNTGFVAGQLEMDDSGYIVTKPDSTQTSVEGVFAAGDVQDRIFRQAVTAAGSGCMAAIEAERWLESQPGR